MPLLALTRAVSPAMSRCELTHLAREPIDLARARDQHAAYARALADLGCTVREVEPSPDLPDSVFIEDAALVLDEIAIVTRPGASSRRPEVEGVHAALAPFRHVTRIGDPGTMDGGDLLRTGRTIFVGRSSRTNDEGIRQLASIVAPYAYDVRGVDVSGCLHLKSAATAVDDGLLLANRSWISARSLAPFEIVDVDPSEPGAANLVSVGGRLLAAAAFPRTRDRLERRGFEVRTVEMSEFAKAEGAVTCCSLIFET